MEEKNEQIKNNLYTNKRDVKRNSEVTCLEETEVSIADLTKGQQVFEDINALFFVDNQLEKPTHTCLKETEISLVNLTQCQQIVKESDTSLFFVDPLYLKNEFPQESKKDEGCTTFVANVERVSAKTESRPIRKSKRKVIT